MEKIKSFFDSSWKLPILIGVCIFPTLYFLGPWLMGHLVNVYFSKFPSSKSSEALIPGDTGPIGDTFGGMLGPTIAIIAAYLTFLAFWIQYRANRLQEVYLKQQRFEDTFFRLLDHHKKNVDSMDVRDLSPPYNIQAAGYESFKLMHEDIEIELKGNKDVKKINDAYEKIQKKYRHDLHHYFRFLYHILKYIKQSNISEDEKFKYTSILRAALSAYELMFVFYNCLHKNGKTHFKPLVEEFSFLKNIDYSLIINEEYIEGYDPLAFASSNERPHLLKEWEKKQKCKCA